MTYKMLGIEFAPLNIPFKRRLQTVSVVIYLWLMIVAPLVCFSVFILVLFSRYYYLALGYVIWMYYDNTINKTPSRGGRKIKWTRTWKLWKLVADFFPITLIKTVELDPERNYLFGYHPHGIAGFGAVCSFATEATGFSEMFKGITTYLLTLKMIFCYPVLRNIPLFLGMCDASKESMEYILTQRGKGNAAVIIIGGAAEALDAQPGTPIVFLRKRKGFIKIAITTGACLVPVFSFGENDLYNQADNPVGSKLRKFQDTFKNITGFSTPFFYGRGVFNYSFGLIPFRKPIYTVVGAPIDVPQIEDPSPAEVDKYHQRYIDALCQLFDEHKSKYGVDENIHLLIQ